MGNFRADRGRCCVIWCAFVSEPPRGPHVLHLFAAGVARQLLQGPARVVHVGNT